MTEYNSAGVRIGRGERSFKGGIFRLSDFEWKDPESPKVRITQSPKSPKIPRGKKLL